jgi:hypothetical protein
MTDFTWEYIVQNSDCRRQLYLSELDKPDEGYHDRYRNWLQSAEGLLAVVPKLREQPEIDKRVPMMSLMTLRWLMGDGFEVDLYCEEKGKYLVAMYKGNLSIEQISVGFDDVAEIVWTYIQKAQRKDANDNATSAAERS